MAPQLSYNLAPTIGKVGGLSRSDSGMHAVAKIANVAIPFGCAVLRDADDVKVKLPTASGDIAIVGKSGGIALATHAIISDGSVAVATFPVGKELAVLRRGTIFVLVEEAVNQGDAAFVRYASGAGGTQLGAFRKSADTSTAAVLPGAYYKTTASAGALAELEVNFGGT